MMTYLSLISIFLMLFQGCGSSDNAKKENPAAKDSVAQHDSVPSAPLKPPPMTAIKPNLTMVGAQVDSVVLLDSVSYRIYVLVGSAIPLGGAESIVELNQRVALEPQYTYRQDGSFDAQDERNKRLLKLRAAVHESVFIAKITLVPSRGLRLIDLESY